MGHQQLDSALTGSGGPASITNSFSYNKRLQPVAMSAATPGQTVFSIGYDFHAGNGTAGSGTDNGNVWGIYNYKDRNRDQTFTYDALNRLISAQNAGTDCSATVLGGNKKYWGNNYAYDAWGNLKNKTPIPTACAGENLAVNVDLTNRLLSGYGYDAAGNMTYDPTPGHQMSYTWDAENRLTGAAGYSYTYDGDGNRVRKSNGNTASSGTLYWYMTPGVVAESDLAGTLKSEYIFFDGERVARKDFPGNTVTYYFSDHLKTASVITDAAGTIKTESDYYPWGGELQFVNNDSNDYKFTGKKRDAETGLDYFGARYYSNGLGRWVSADWSATPVPVPYADFGDPQSLNLYGYVGGNPATKFDVDGHEDNQKSLWQRVKDTVRDILTSTQPSAPQLPTPSSGCTCPESQKQDNNKQNNNNSQSTNQRSKTDAPGSSKRPGTRGKPDHQATSKEEAARIGGKTEVTIKTPGGSKGSRRADAAQTDANGSYQPGGKIVQVIRPTPDGNVPKREAEAAQDIQNATGVKPELVPVRPLPKNQD